MTQRRQLLLAAPAWAAMLGAPRAFAQADYPSKPIKIIVPFGAGSAFQRASPRSPA